MFSNNFLQIAHQVLLHSQGEFADVDDRGFVIGPGTET